MARRTARGIPLSDCCETLRRIAPTELAADWDNVGLLVAPRGGRVVRALVSGDLTPAVLDESVGWRAGLVVAYHPPIFKTVKALRVGRDSPEGLAAEALQHGVAVYSPHTAWDAADGGMNDALIALCGVESTRPFGYPTPGPGRECKLVTFVPAASVDAVADAMFAAGAGRIGDYTHCSFRIPGQGTFFGTDATNPRVGRRGRLERVEEIRLEAVVPVTRVPEVVEAMRRAHPYEEPAFDIHPLADHPSIRAGQGRIGELTRPVALGSLARRLATRVRANAPTLVGDRRAAVRRVLVCAGAAGSLPFELHGDRCGPGDAIITGEIRHHDALRILRCGASAVALGHWSSERPGVTALARRLAREWPDVDVRLSRTDREPFESVG